MIEGNVIHNVNIGIEIASEHAGRVHQDDRGPQQPGRGLDDDRDRDRWLRPPARKHRGLPDREQHGGRTPTASRSWCSSTPATTSSRTTSSWPARATLRREPLPREPRQRGRPQPVLSRRGRFRAGSWSGKGVDYGDFDSWSARSGVDGRTRLRRPGFIDATNGRLLARARIPPAVDAGTFIAVGGLHRRSGDASVQAGVIDLGAFEAAAPPPSPTPSISEPDRLCRRSHVGGVENGWGPPEVDRSNGEKAPDDGGPITIGGRGVRPGDRRARPVADLGSAGRPLLGLPRRRRPRRRGRRPRLGHVRGPGGTVNDSLSAGVVRGPQTAVPIAPTSKASSASSWS